MWDRVEKFVTAYGWPAALIVVVVLVLLLWWVGVDIPALLQGRLP